MSCWDNKQMINRKERKDRKEVGSRSGAALFREAAELPSVPERAALFGGTEPLRFLAVLCDLGVNHDGRAASALVTEALRDPAVLEDVIDGYVSIVRARKVR